MVCSSGKRFGATRRGDFFGRKQSGMPEFKMADLVHDYRALDTARKDAEKFLASNEFWEAPEYATFKESNVEESGALRSERID